MSLKNKRASVNKKRKLHDNSDEISFDCNLDLCINSELNKDSQTSMEGYRDLFGELIPPDECISNVEVKSKSVKKTPVSKKRKLPYEDIFIDTPVIKPKRVFISTPKMIKTMMEAQKEFYSFMGVHNSLNDVSIVSNDSLNVSGVQRLPDSPVTSVRNERNSENNENDKKSQQVFKGVVAFVDYKIDNERCDSSITQNLINLGAKVVKTFNKKVTHVMFCDGYRSTYNKAIERNVPLVSARWMKYSKLANKLQDPADYPPVGMEKYTKTPSKVINIPKCKTYQKFLEPSNIERDQLFKSTCDNLMKQFNLSINHCNENKNNCCNIETSQKTIVNTK